MSSSFLLTLDTVTHVLAVINGGNESTENTTVTLELDLDPDADEVKIWGDINPLDPGNAGMGETEAGATWLPAQPDFLVALTTNPGLKRLHVLVRDDVWNEAEAEATIQLAEGEVAPPVTPPRQHPEPRPAKGPPEPTPERRHRAITVASAAGRVRDHASIINRRSAVPNPASRMVSGVRLAIRNSVVSSQGPTSVETSVRARVVGLRQPEPAARSAATRARRDGAEFVASLEALGLL